MKRFFSLVAAILIVSTALSAQEIWKLDKSHANIGFTVTHMLISEVPGSFKDFDIRFTASKPDFSDASVNAMITVASLSTDNDRRDGHLKSDDFFNAETYPAITFASTKFEKTGETSYNIHGDLTIRDITKPVTFDAKLTGVLETPRGTVSGWKASLTINRFDYELKWNRALETGGLIVGEDIDITLNAEFMRSTQAGG